MSVDLAERLERCHAAAVFDVLRGRGLADTVLPPDIVPLDPKRRLAGPVFTLRGRPAPGTDPHATLLAWTGFLSRAPAAHVVVCEGNDRTRALMGELSAETLHRKGVRGYVTDGGCRDCGVILEIGFPVFCAFRTPRDVVGA
jgi:regulator of RNase E activity RraA